MWADEQALSQRVISPRDCLLAFGLPTTEADFEVAAHDPGRDYARHYLGGWKQYNHNFVKHVIAFTQRYSELKVRIVDELRISDVNGLFSKATVITLFTHWTAYGVELCDGILSPSQFVELVPRQFSGVFDLCVCHPDDLVRLLLRDRPLCSVRYLSDETNPVFWLHFYSAVYKVAGLGGRTYPEILEEVTHELRRQTKKHTKKKER